MKKFELTTLLRPELEKAEDEVVAKIQKIITDVGGLVIKWESQGKKRLSETIKGHDYAVYERFIIAVPEHTEFKVSNFLYRLDEIITYLIITTKGESFNE